jgi:hypothetical protein
MAPADVGAAPAGERTAVADGGAADGGGADDWATGGPARDWTAGVGPAPGGVSDAPAEVDGGHVADWMADLDVPASVAPADPWQQPLAGQFPVGPSNPARYSAPGYGQPHPRHLDPDRPTAGGPFTPADVAGADPAPVDAGLPEGPPPAWSGPRAYPPVDDAVPPADPVAEPVFRRRWLPSLRTIGSAVTITAVLATIAVLAGTLGGVTVRPAAGGGEPRPQFVPPLDGRTVSAPRGALSDAIFELVTGRSTVRLRTADLGGDLYRVSTSADSAPPPAPVTRGNQVLFRLAGADGAAPGVVDVQLSTQVRWQLRLTGVAARHQLDLTTAKLASVEVQGRAALVDLNLPPAIGTLLVRLSGATDQVNVRAPQGRPVKARARVGAGVAVVNGRRTTGAGPDTVFLPPDWDYATDRYYLDFVARLGTLTVAQT